MVTHKDLIEFDGHVSIERRGKEREKGESGRKKMALKFVEFLW